VTPLSQFYFQQAFNNVLFGPWERMADGYGRTVLGYFGRTPVPPDPEIVRIASEKLGLPPTTRSPLEMSDENPAKGIAAATGRLEAAGLPVTDENIFIAATCEEKGIAFLKGDGKVGVRKIALERAETAPPDRYLVTVDGVPFDVRLGDGQAVVDGRQFAVDVREAGIGAGPTGPAAPAANGLAIEARMPGAVVKILVRVGDRVRAGDTLLVLEAMKMEVDVKAPRAGTVSALAVSVGGQVAAGRVLARLQ
jgi:pyruvate carboxylase subunit B